MDYKEIKPELVVNTIERLEARIADRFPNVGLRQVCAELSSVAKNAQERSEWISRPVRWLRWLVFSTCLLVFAISVGSVILIFDVDTETVTEVANAEVQKLGLTEAIQVLEAALNDIVLIGAALFFLLSLETRYKRARALKAIHELRSIAHIIDMHQLTKDPHRITGKKVFRSTEGSPKLEMTQFLLRRYLDYCSEMLSLTGKIAAVYAQEFDDQGAITGASELETLTTGLSRKIWQKIAMLHTIEEESE